MRRAYFFFRKNDGAAHGKTLGELGKKIPDTQREREKFAAVRLRGRITRAILNLNETRGDAAVSVHSVFLRFCIYADQPDLWDKKNAKTYM